MDDEDKQAMLQALADMNISLAQFTKLQSIIQENIIINMDDCIVVHSKTILVDIV